MRINVRIYYRDPNSLEIMSALLLPTQNNLNNINAAPMDFEVQNIEPNRCLKFFGNTLINGMSNNSINNWQLWNGAVRNIMIFNTFLDENQLYNLFVQSIAKFYNWSDFGEYNIIKQINSNSYLGCVYAYNTKLINVLHTLLKSNTTDLSNIIFE